ncbi:hypothetical protein CVT24_001290 [Panaeolus cyanescens]|uniref:Uncharacterized protein n=1 Tax=Panaeolus cyanescens TaxID=181874 RepID=A0A409YZ63_9AGAR|nr:hypothetical protein CVT24_001290 [Panaeolus cyanescens]
MGPVSDAVVSTFGSSIMVEIGLKAGFEGATKLANDLVFSKPINKIVPIHSDRLDTTGVKVLLITLQFKSTMEDAALGFYRSSVHDDTSLFATVKDYLAVEKGWFSPYLFASARRPIIPRSMKPDVVFCHGPFLSGDYQIGETLLNESASVIALCPDPPAEAKEDPTPSEEHGTAKLGQRLKDISIPSISNLFSRSRSPSPDAELAAVPPPPIPRRMVILVVGLKPHRKLWTSSARPGESVINYVLLNGCPSVVVPVKTGAPLLAWDGLTLEQLWEVKLPASEGEKSPDGKFEGIVDVLFEYMDLCVEWDRVTLGDDVSDVVLDDQGVVEDGETAKKEALKDALSLLVAAAVKSKNSKEAREELDEDRAGIAMWRIP